MCFLGTQTRPCSFASQPRAVLQEDRAGILQPEASGGRPLAPAAHLASFAGPTPFAPRPLAARGPPPTELQKPWAQRSLVGPNGNGQRQGGPAEPLPPQRPLRGASGRGGGGPSGGPGGRRDLRAGAAARGAGAGGGGGGGGRGGRPGRGAGEVRPSRAAAPRARLRLQQPGPGAAPQGRRGKRPAGPGGGAGAERGRGAGGAPGLRAAGAHPAPAGPPAGGAAGPGAGGPAREPLRPAAAAARQPLRGALQPDAGPSPAGAARTEAGPGGLTAAVAGIKRSVSASRVRLVSPPVPSVAQPQDPPRPAAPEAAMDGRALPEAEGRAVSCLAPAPSLAWYRSGERQESDGAGRLVASAGADGGGSFAVTARRLERRLNCSATDPLTGQVSSASVLLDVQFQPELLEVDAQLAEAEAEPGLLLVLLVLVRARPPASITWVDRDGRRLLNASSFLLVDAATFPAANHSLRLRLRGPAWNASFDAAAGASDPPPGFLDTRVELPLLALVVGGAAALGTLLALGALSCLACRKGKAAAGLALPAPLPLSTSNTLKPMGAQLPRANWSLPANLKLSDLAPEARAKIREGGTAVEQGGEAASEPEDSLALAHRGLGQFPMVGYIYRASSMSSDEIWL